MHVLQNRRGWGKIQQQLYTRVTKRDNPRQLVTTCTTKRQPNGQSEPKNQQPRQNKRRSCVHENTPQQLQDKNTPKPKNNQNTKPHQPNNLSQLGQPIPKLENSQLAKHSKPHCPQEEVVYKGLFTTTNREKTLNTQTQHI